MSLSLIRMRRLMVASFCISGLIATSPWAFAQDEPVAPVAEGVQAPDDTPIVPTTQFPSLIALDPGDTVWTLKVTDGSLRVNGDVAVNSTNRGAIWMANGVLEAQNGTVGVVGGVSRLGKNMIRPLESLGANVVSDPLPEFGIPSPGNVVSRKQLFVRSEEVGEKLLSPGIYNGGIFATGKGRITLKPGVYIIVDGDFSAIGPTIEGEGITIVMAGAKAGGLSISLGAKFNASAPTSGRLKDLLVISRAAGTFASGVSFASAEGNMKGIIYAPNASVATQYSKNVTVSKIIAKSVSVTAGHLEVTGFAKNNVPETQGVEAG